MDGSPSSARLGQVPRGFLGFEKNDVNPLEDNELVYDDDSLYVHMLA